MGKSSCSVCGSGASVRWAPRPGQIPGAAHAGRWICGDCLYVEEYPEAERRELPADRSDRKHPQKESLL